MQTLEPIAVFPEKQLRQSKNYNVEEKSSNSIKNQKVWLIFIALVKTVKTGNKQHKD